MRRRTFIALLGGAALACPLAVRAQQPAGKVYRIGVLSSASKPTDAEVESPWLLALRDLGWIEGQNVVIERRYSEGKADLLPGLARELVSANVDVIATFGSGADTNAARQATSVIPIVIVFGGLDPVAEGLITSFARPGGNITGVSRMLSETDAKRLELIKEMVPLADRIGVLANTRGPDSRARFEERMNTAAHNLRVELQFFPYRNEDDVEAAFPAMVSMHVQAFVLEPNFFTFENRDRIAVLALKHRLPGAFTLRGYAEAGGLMSFGPDWAVVMRMHAHQIDRVLRGANPGDLPMEQPTKFELVVNLKTAEALGLTVPQLILLRADEVLE